MRASRRSGSCLYDSRGKAGLVDCTGVEGVESPEAFLDLEKNFMETGEVEVELPEESFDVERKMPLKLIRRGDLGEESCGKGKTVLGEPGLCFTLTGAETGLDGRW